MKNPGKNEFVRCSFQNSNGQITECGYLKYVWAGYGLTQRAYNEILNIIFQ